MTTTIERPGRIATTHPLREAFADCSGFYEILNDALRTFADTLECWPFYLDRERYYKTDWRRGGNKIPVYDENGRKMGLAYFTWYRIPGEGWEVYGHIGPGEQHVNS